MMDIILASLSISDNISFTKNIDIAKGMYKMPGSFKEALIQYKRQKRWQ